MRHKEIYTIFKQGSKTYFNTSLFFPKKVREDVFILYSFVRIADNFVDTLPQQKKAFLQFKKDYLRKEKGARTDNFIINQFQELIQRKKIDKHWVHLFLKAMEMDLNKKKYATLNQTKEYMVGSAEVIGLMMAKILGLDPKSFPYARLLGRSMQYINFIRDINEDLTLGRIYLPQSELKKYKLKNLNKNYINQHSEEFKKFIQAQIKYYFGWVKEAEQGYRYIPKRYLIPIKTASDMYQWTAETIRKDPMIIYRKKVKPGKGRILLRILFNLMIFK